MKKLFIFIMIASYWSLQGQFVDFKETASKNKFLGVGMSACSTQTNHSKNSYQKGYDCGNSTISQLLNVNLLAAENIGQQFYIFNDFMYWMGKSNQTAINTQPDQKFSGSGVFMIVIGSSAYLQNIAGVADKSCPEGKNWVVAQLKYNDGNSLRVWSQDAMCLAPTDSFAIEISSDLDTFAQSAINSSSSNAQGIDWMKDAGPTANYQQAGDSPRKIRFVMQSSAVEQAPGPKKGKAAKK